MGCVEDKLAAARLSWLNAIRRVLHGDGPVARLGAEPATSNVEVVEGPDCKLRQLLAGIDSKGGASVRPLVVFVVPPEPNADAADRGAPGLEG